jgi:hypothetical protein
MWIALLGCSLFLAICVPAVMSAEAIPNSLELDKAEATRSPEQHTALLAIQSLNVIPMTDNELDQIVGAARIDLNLDLSVLVGPLNVDITGTIELGDDGPRIQVDVTNN